MLRQVQLKVQLKVRLPRRGAEHHNQLTGHSTNVRKNLETYLPPANQKMIFKAICISRCAPAEMAMPPKLMVDWDSPNVAGFPRLLAGAA